MHGAKTCEDNEKFAAKRPAERSEDSAAERSAEHSCQVLFALCEGKWEVSREPYREMWVGVTAGLFCVTVCAFGGCSFPSFKVKISESDACTAMAAGAKAGCLWPPGMTKVVVAAVVSQMTISQACPRQRRNRTKV